MIVVRVKVSSGIETFSPIGINSADTGQPCFFEIVVWRLAFWSCIDVIVVRVKVSSGIETFSPIGINSADTIVNRPMGRFAWTNHIYFQITQPSSSNVTPLYQQRRQNCNRKKGENLV